MEFITMTPSTFDIKIVQKQATPGPITTAIGTGSSATRTEFFIAIDVRPQVASGQSASASPAPQGVTQHEAPG